MAAFPLKSTIVPTMKKLYLLRFFILLISSTVFTKIAVAQCNTLTAVCISFESRCAATGAIQINASGGSGNYQYKATGPVNTNFTTSSLITGLPPGFYLVTVKDIISNCVFTKDSVKVNGNYLAPSFLMQTTDVTCINGSDGTITVTSQSAGRAPFSYKIIAPSASGVGTTNTTGLFTGLISGNYLVQLTDSCGAIQTRSATIQNYNWFILNYTVTKIVCDSILVSLTLKDSKNNTSPNPIFNGFSYGASVTPGDTTWFPTSSFRYFKGNKHRVTLLAKDQCGNIKYVIWTDTAFPKVDANVQISNRACSTFTATVTGQTNLTAPNYCIYNNSNVLLSCNSNGIFNNLPYGSYCIKITDNCYDTVINRCFTITKPIPYVDPIVKIQVNCNEFTAIITGQANWDSAVFCLYDSNAVLMYCNNTGVFSGLPFGRYCIKISNNPACYDTSMMRCFTVLRPVPKVGAFTITNKTCSTFSLIIADTSNLSNPQYCLYTAQHVVIICNSTGIFDNLPYGTYCVDVINDPICYDTTISKCFTVDKPKPSVDAAVTISNRTCTGYTATITGLNNVYNPQFCLYDNLSVLLYCNTTGVFNNLSYGMSYCVQIKNNPDCYDTIITRCFVAKPIPVSISLSAKKSCTTIGATEIKVNINSGVPAYTIVLYRPDGTVVQSITTGSNNYTFLNVPGLTAAQKYKVVVTDLCGNKDSAFVTPLVSVANRQISITTKCPSGIWPNGSGDVLIDISNNNIGGNISPKIIKKNGAVVNISPSSSIGYQFSFLNLGPATYIFDTYLEDCNKHIFDTVLVRPYVFPQLTGTNAYQCDDNSFQVAVSVTNGMAPYQYEIIGSEPASPSIITPPQASPNFTINNGAIYSLIRLRVVDACGNASLYDVSVLPLGNFIVFADTSECFGHSLTLRVDSIPNATYAWYKRIPPNDSILLGTGPSLYFANLTQADTGRYFCKIVVSNGCIIKYANYILTGFCTGVLPAGLSLAGEKQWARNKLYWNNTSGTAQNYSLEKSLRDDFRDAICIHRAASGIQQQYTFYDTDPAPGKNYYRLRMIQAGGGLEYSNIICINNLYMGIQVYPNPVKSSFYVAIKNTKPKNYVLELYNATGKRMSHTACMVNQESVVEIIRTAQMNRGVYFLVIQERAQVDKQIFRLLFE